MSEEKEKRATELKTTEFRVSYPSLFKPKFNDLANKNEFVVEALFEKKKTNLKSFEKIMAAAKKLQWGDGKLPKNLREPIKDGDESEKPEHAGHWIMTFKSSEDYPPVVVGTKRGGDGKFIRLTEKEVYGGCYGRAIINAFAYDKKNAKGTTISAGVSFGLVFFQKLRDGEKFGGGVSLDIEDEFGDIAEDAEDDTGFDDSSDDDNVSDDNFDFG